MKWGVEPRATIWKEQFSQQLQDIFVKSSFKILLEQLRKGILKKNIV